MLMQAKISKTLLFVASAAIILMAMPAAAQTYISVVKKASTGKEPISIADLVLSGPAAEMFKSVLKQDLERSGFFEVRNDRSSRLAITGTATSSGESLATSIRVTWSNGTFVWAERTLTKRDARWQAHRLNDKIVESIKGVKGMASTRIAFVGKDNGRSGGICLCDYDGFGAVHLTNEKISPLSPYFDPTGQFIFYTSFDRGYPCVFRVPAAGGQRAAYANFVGLNTGGAVSPDGRFIAVILSHVGNPELFVLNLNDRKAYRQTHTKNASEASPCWSPDGSRIVYVSDQSGRPQIYIVNSDSAHTSTRISHRGTQNVAPSWGADGRIAYCTNQNGGWQIAVYDPTNATEKVITSGYDHEDPSWAPDGRHIVCSRRKGVCTELCIIDTEDESSVVVLPLPAGNWRSPEWSSKL